MATVATDGRQGGHYFSGKTANVPFFTDYSASVSDHARRFLSDFLSHHFPGQSFEVVGALWDYSQSSDPEHATLPYGHFRVRHVGDGREFVVCVDSVEPQEALELGAPIYQGLEVKGVKIAPALYFGGACASPEDFRFSEVFQANNTDVFVHFEAYIPDAEWVMMAGLRGKERQLAYFAASMSQISDAFQEHKDSDPDVADYLRRLEDYSDKATLTNWRFGADTISRVLHNRETAADDEIEAVDLLKEAMGAEALAEVSDIMCDVLSNPKVITHFNAIEKMFWHVGDDICISGMETVSRGYVPLMKGNASYDIGAMTTRIFLNKSMLLPDGPDYSAVEIEYESLECLYDFVDAYNSHVDDDKRLSVEDCLEAAKRYRTMLMAYMVGSYILDPRPLARKTLQDHARSTLAGMEGADHMIERHRQLAPVIEAERARRSKPVPQSFEVFVKTHCSGLPPLAL